VRITVLLGGTSSERDVSIASGLLITQALRQRGHTVTAVDTVHGPFTERAEQETLQQPVMKRTPPSRETLATMRAHELERLAQFLPSPADTDVVFVGLHGGTGEDGRVQALLDLAGLRYTGSGSMASALAMDKDLSKRLFHAAGVQTAKWIMIPADAESVRAEIGYPAIVKPANEGSTVGLSLIKREEELAGAIAHAARHDAEVMIEQYIPGRELTVGVLGGRALPVGEIMPRHEIYDYECKYTPGMATEQFPADLPEAQAARLQEQAVSAFRALKLRGYARIDFRMTAQGETFCLEANTLPGMTELSLMPQAARAAGIPFPELCEQIAMLALTDKERR
jgi:D-alanine-D-alanine ligase